MTPGCRREAATDRGRPAAQEAMATPPSAENLARAAARGDRETVRRLLHHGVPVHHTNKFGRTALQVARLCCTDLIRDLLNAGANPNLRDVQTKGTVCHDAARSGLVDTLRLLLEHGADLQARDRWGNTPAHAAAKSGDFRLVRYLALGADVRDVNQAGLSPLDYLEAVDDPACRQWVETARRKPRTLQSCCVLVIRGQLGSQGLRRLREDSGCPDGIKKVILLQSHPALQPFPSTSLALPGCSPAFPST